MAEKRFIKLTLPIIVNDNSCDERCSQFRRDFDAEKATCNLESTKPLQLQFGGASYARSLACDLNEVVDANMYEIDPACSVIVVKKD